MGDRNRINSHLRHPHDGHRKPIKELIMWLSEILIRTVRLLVGAYPRWEGTAPSNVQRIYFANHTSHMDTLVLWAALPRELRNSTRPVAAKD